MGFSFERASGKKKHCKKGRGVPDEDLSQKASSYVAEESLDEGGCSPTFLAGEDEPRESIRAQAPFAGTAAEENGRPEAGGGENDCREAPASHPPMTPKAPEESAVASCALPRPAVRLQAGYHTVTGKREKNDDSACIGAEEAGMACLGVADGIGGASDGDILSRVAANVGVSRLEQGYDCIDSVREANKAAIQTKEWIMSPHAGSTLLLANQDGDGGTLELAWVGDTIAMRLRGGALEQITEAGRVSAASNALDSAIGYDLEIEPRRTRCDVAPGDKFILCTDGVWESLPDERIAQMLEGAEDAQSAAIEIAIEAARRGTDNSTALVAFANADGEKAGHPDPATPEQQIGTDEGGCAGCRQIGLGEEGDAPCPIS